MYADTSADVVEKEYVPAETLDGVTVIQSDDELSRYENI